MRILGYIIMVLFASTAVGQQINPVPDYIFRYQMSVGRNAATDTAAYLSIGPRFGAVKGFQPPMVVDTASFSGSKRNGLTIFSVQKNKYVYWDSVGVKWAEMAGTAGNAITGLGTANYVPRFTTSTNLANSGIYQTPGGKIVIGSTTDSASLFNVNGTAKTGTLIVKSTTQEVRIANNFPTGRPGKNIFIGTGGQALITASGDSSSFNTSLGDSALSSLTSGWQNSAVGYEALKKATTARANMAFGHRALRDLTTGRYNVGIGYEALLLSSTSIANTAIGSSAMQNTTSDFSVGVGYISLFNQTTGYNNTAVGAETMTIGTAMANSVAVGYGGMRNVTGDDNTGVGFSVMYELTTGSKNVAVGYEAGRYITSGGNNQTSTNSIYIGYDSRASANGNANEIVIGYQGRGNGSNTVTIGNSSTTSNYFTGSIYNTTGAVLAASSGNVGVGTTSPQQKFVVSNAGAEGVEFVPGTSNIIQSYNRSTSAFTPLVSRGSIHNIQIGTDAALYIDASRNIGIGNTAPSERLHVNGKVRIATIDSSASPINMLWADATGVVRKTAVPSGNATWIYDDFIQDASGWDVAKGTNDSIAIYDYARIQSTDSTSRLSALTVVFYRDSAGFAADTWVTIGTLPQPSRPKRTIYGALPNYVDGADYLTTGAQVFTGNASYGGKCVYRIKSNGNIDVRVGTVDAAIQRSGTAYVIFPITAAFERVQHDL